MRNFPSYFPGSPFLPQTVPQVAAFKCARLARPAPVPLVPLLTLRLCIIATSCRYTVGSLTALTGCRRSVRPGVPLGVLSLVEAVQPLVLICQYRGHLWSGKIWLMLSIVLQEPEV